MTKTAKRRRYIFADRAEAEDAFGRKQRDLDAHRMALQAVVAGPGIEWLNGPPTAEDRGEYYRVGTIGHARGDGGCAVIVYTHPGQSDLVYAYPSGDLRDVIARMGVPMSNFERDYRDLLYQAAVKCGW